MKAMVLRGPGEPFVEEEYPDPVAGPGEAVAKVLACGAGLTIHHARMGRVPDVTYPLIIGHEITAVITALGEGVEGLQEGRRGDRPFLRHLREVQVVPHQPRDAVRELHGLHRPPGAGRLCGIHQAARTEFHQNPRRTGLREQRGGGLRHLRRDSHPV